MSTGTHSERVYIVTGSSRGIGREIARELLAHGAAVVLNGRNAEVLEATRSHLAASYGNRVLAVAADVSTEEGARHLVGDTLASWGAIDGLVCNAGLSMRGPIGKLRQATVDQLYAANVLSTVLPTVAALPSLIERKGSVVCVTTVGAMYGFPGVSIYAASKAAVERFAQSLDAEHRRDDLHVALVYLGFVENDEQKLILTADGSAVHHQRSAQMTQQEAAEAVRRAIERRRRTVVTIASGRLLRIALRIAPGLVAYLLARGKRDIHRSDVTPT